jgi:hypothetical protein
MARPDPSDPRTEHYLSIVEALVVQLFSMSPEAGR